ncbi:MAG TPA: hypothetical protein VH280_24175 [Verrucomicrobiae bacterium]|jgi:hypothetical protein|nr:hypothetical protein [Verrucomicrobiae bacterium]
MNDLLNLSAEQLRRVADIKERIESLQYELGRVLGGGSAGRVPGGRIVRMSAAGRARIAAAQRARWAKFNSARGKSPKVAGAKPRRTLSAAAKAKIAAAARSRWARAKAAGRSRL